MRKNTREKTRDFSLKSAIKPATREKTRDPRKKTRDPRQLVYLIYYSDFIVENSWYTLPLSRSIVFNFYLFEGNTYKKIFQILNRVSSVIKIFCLT